MTRQLRCCGVFCYFWYSKLFNWDKRQCQFCAQIFHVIPRHFAVCITLGCIMLVIRWLLLASISILPFYARADYGLGAISIVCDSKTNSVEIEPLIIWNQELNLFLSKNPGGELETKTRFTKTFDGVVNFSHVCRLKNKIIHVSIQGNVLDVQENGKAIASKKIGYVWFAHGEEYSLKSSSQGQWQECVGSAPGLVGHPVECGPVTPSETTDEKDVDAHRERLASNKT